MWNASARGHRRRRWSGKRGGGCRCRCRRLGAGHCGAVVAEGAENGVPSASDDHGDASSTRRSRRRPAPRSTAPRSRSSCAAVATSKPSGACRRSPRIGGPGPTTSRSVRLRHLAFGELRRTPAPTWPGGEAIAQDPFPGAVETAEDPRHRTHGAIDRRRHPAPRLHHRARAARCRGLRRPPRRHGPGLRRIRPAPRGCVRWPERGAVVRSARPDLWRRDRPDRDRVPPPGGGASTACSHRARSSATSTCSSARATWPWSRTSWASRRWCRSTRTCSAGSAAAPARRGTRTASTWDSTHERSTSGRRCRRAVGTARVMGLDLVPRRLDGLARSGTHDALHPDGRAGRRRGAGRRTRQADRPSRVRSGRRHLLRPDIPAPVRHPAAPRGAVRHRILVLRPVDLP